MKTRTIVIIALALVTLLGVLYWRADVACSIPRHRAALRIGEAAGCIEFWLNRYQTAWAGLIGAAAALLAAWVAWRSIHMQIERDNRAREEDGRRAAFNEARQIELEITALRSIEERLIDFQAQFGEPSNETAYEATLTLRRVTLPSSLGLLYIPHSKTYDRFLVWCQKLQDYYTRCISLHPRPASVVGPGIVIVELEELDFQIRAAVDEIDEMRRFAMNDIGHRQQRFVGLGFS